MLVFNIDLCSAISMESPRRDLWKDVAEHRPNLEINQNKYGTIPVSVSLPPQKKGVERVFRFNCVNLG